MSHFNSANQEVCVQLLRLFYSVSMLQLRGCPTYAQYAYTK